MVKLYIESDGDQKRLKSECRRAFANFFRKAGFNEKALPKQDDIEAISKNDLMTSLENA